MHVRIARATNDLEMMVKMYTEALDLEVIGTFQDHDGFSGSMLGSPSLDYHFEFTQELGHMAPNSHSPESLVVFYIPEATKFKKLQEQMIKAGFIKVESHNPYWDQNGVTFEDPEKYRIVLCERKWG